MTIKLVARQLTTLSTDHVKRISSLFSPFIKSSLLFIYYHLFSGFPFLTKKTQINTQTHQRDN